MAQTAETKERDVLGRLADRGEGALHKLADLPGSTKAVKAFSDLRGRVDELSKKVRGIDALERRLAKLEKEVGALKRAGKPAAAKAKPKAAPRKPAA